MVIIVVNNCHRNAGALFYDRGERLHNGVGHIIIIIITIVVIFHEIINKYCYHRVRQR
jgi:hypothetical protein